MRALSIGSLEIPGRVVMAPMAGVGGSVFRRIAREQGAALVVTPLVSAEGLVRGDRKCLAAATIAPEEAPCAVQIFGGDPAVMARAARILEARGAPLVDINAGCPSPRIVATSAGAALMRDPERLRAIVGAVADAVSVPVTVKVRLGWSPREISVVPAVHACTQGGAFALTVHARFKTDGFSSSPRWEWIKAAVAETHLPVIGNGGIRAPQDARAMLESTGCAGVMVGRAAVGRPWLLRQCAQALAGETPEPDPPLGARLEVALRHLELQRALDVERHAVRATAGVLAAYFRTAPKARQMRTTLLQAKTYDELHHLISGTMRGVAFGEEESAPTGP